MAVYFSGECFHFPFKFYFQKLVHYDCISRTSVSLANNIHMYTHIYACRFHTLAILFPVNIS